MTVYMGITMSFVLSLVGTLAGGHFTIVSWLISFGISLVISLVIGCIVPIKKLGDAACAKCKVDPQSMKGNLLSALISDLIYTPVITVVMVSIMMNMVKKQIAAAGRVAVGFPTLGQALVPALIITLLVGFIVIALIQPVFIKMLVKKYAGPQKE